VASAPSGQIWPELTDKSMHHASNSFAIKSMTCFQSKLVDNIERKTVGWMKCMTNTARPRRAQQLKAPAHTFQLNTYSLTLEIVAMAHLCRETLPTPVEACSLCRAFATRVVLLSVDAEAPRATHIELAAHFNQQMLHVSCF
jgi:hypothetical protein